MTTTSGLDVPLALQPGKYFFRVDGDEVATAYSTVEIVKSSGNEPQVVELKATAGRVVRWKVPLDAGDCRLWFLGSDTLEIRSANHHCDSDQFVWASYRAGRASFLRLGLQDDGNSLSARVASGAHVRLEARDASGTYVSNVRVNDGIESRLIEPRHVPTARIVLTGRHGRDVSTGQLQLAVVLPSGKRLTLVQTLVDARRVVLDDIGAGRYEIQWVDGSGLASAAVQVADPGDYDVELGPGMVTELEDTSVFLRDTDGVPLEGVSVSAVTSAGAGNWALSDEDGRVVLSVPRGEQILVAAWSRSHQAVDAFVTAGETATLFMSPLCTHAISVSGPREFPSGSLVVSDGQAEVFRTAITSWMGDRLEIPRLPCKGLHFVYRAREDGEVYAVGDAEWRAGAYQVQLVPLRGGR